MRLTLMAVLITCTVSFTGCRAPTSAISVSPCASSQGVSTTSAGRPSLAFNAPACADGNGLHIQSSGVDCGAAVVLNRQQTTYDVGAIQQMSAYLRAFNETYVTSYFRMIAEASAPATFNAQYEKTLPPLPSALQVVPANLYSHLSAMFHQCTGHFEITNTGSSDIQVIGFGATFITAPVPNTAQYQLVDECSLPDLAAVCGNGGIGGNEPCLYDATLNLRAGSAGTHVNAPITSSDDSGNCSGPITIAPGNLAEVNLEFDSPSALLYTARLTVTVSTTGTTVITLPASFNTTLAFASKSQFSCYGFQNNTFVVEHTVDRMTYCL